MDHHPPTATTVYLLRSRDPRAGAFHREARGNREGAARTEADGEVLWLIESGKVPDRALFRFLVPRMVMGVDAHPLIRPLYKDVTNTVLGMVESDADRAQLAAGLGRVVRTTTSKAEALRALGALGPRAKSAGPAVRGLVDDPVLGRIARETLSKIRVATAGRSLRVLGTGREAARLYANGREPAVASVSDVE